jgi:hypothetical protein
MQKIQKEAAVAHFMALSQNLPGRTEENNKVRVACLKTKTSTQNLQNMKEE